MNRIMTDDDMKRASETLRKYDSWSILSHKKADGDATGSATALYEAGIIAGKRVRWFGPDINLSGAYTFLSHFNDFTHADSLSFDEPDELYVFIDCSNDARSVGGYDTHKNINSLNIDHHEDNSMYCRVNCVDGYASSACEVLFRVLKAGNWKLNQNIIESLYTGMYTDSGGFTFSNTSPLTHRLAAELLELGVKPAHMSDLIAQNKTLGGLGVWGRAFSRIKTFGEDNMFAVSWLCAEDFRQEGASNTETEGLPNMLMSIKGVKMIAVVSENTSGDVRVSLRSREGAPFGAGETARELGGGGHEKAAGATMHGSVQECAEEIAGIMLRKYHELRHTD